MAIDPQAFAEAFKTTVEATIDGDRLNVYAGRLAPAR